MYLLDAFDGGMKSLLAVLLISTLQTELKCDENSKLYINSKIDGKPLEKTLKVLSFKKFGPIKKGNEKDIFLKKHVEAKPYTVFPPHPEYPSGFESSRRKSRVKKVLPDDGFAFSRVKRSPNLSNNKIVPKAAVSNVQKAKQVGEKSKKALSKNAKKLKMSAKRQRHRKHKLRKNAMRLKSKAGKNNTLLKKTKKALRNRKHIHKHKKNKGTKSLLRNQNLKKSNVNPKVRSRRMIAARDAMIEDYPYVVSIQKANVHWCSGALLNQRLVITTANCIWKSNRKSRLRIRAGSRYYDRGGQTAKIQEVAKHPLWNIRKPPDYDIALLLLDRLLKFSASIHAVDLPNKEMMPPFNDAWITSWGSDRRDGVFDDTTQSLQVYHAPLMDREACNNVTMRFGVYVSRNFICLAQDGKRGPCTRDTGAPAVSDGIVWGLASWGIRKLCGTERYPAMFTYVASTANLDFIANATSYLMSEEHFNPPPDRLPLLHTVKKTEYV